MKKEPIDLSQFTHRLLQFLLTGLVACVLYFVKDIHSDFKEVKNLVNKHETQLQVHTTEIAAAQQNIIELKQCCNGKR